LKKANSTEDSYCTAFLMNVV